MESVAAKARAWSRRRARGPRSASSARATRAWVNRTVPASDGWSSSTPAPTARSSSRPRVERSTPVMVASTRSLNSSPSTAAAVRVSAAPSPSNETRCHTRSRRVAGTSRPSGDETWAESPRISRRPERSQCPSRWSASSGLPAVSASSASATVPTSRPAVAGTRACTSSARSPRSRPSRSMRVNRWRARSARASRTWSGVASPVSLTRSTSSTGEDPRLRAR